MKRLVLIAKLLFLTAISMAQTFEVSPEYWSTATDTSAFDGISRAALVVGTSDMIYVGSPIISVNKTGDQPTKIFLSYLPATTCRNTVIDIRFDEESIYTLSGKYSLERQRYTLIFTSKMTINTFIDKLKTCKVLHVRLSNEAHLFINVDFTLNGVTEALAIFQ